MSRAFYDIERFPDLVPILKCWQGLWSDLANTPDLLWVDYSVEDNECVEGQWDIAPVFTRVGMKPDGRRPKPRPRGLGRAGERAFLRACREQPKRIPSIYDWFSSFDRVNFVGLSRMSPGCELDAHTHDNPDSLVMHIGCMVPEDGAASLVVGDTEFVWREPGTYCIFDDSIIHSAWNHGETDRIVLHIDFEKEI